MTERALRALEAPAEIEPLRDASAPLLDPPESFFTVQQGDARRLDLMLSPYSSARRPLLTSTITSPPYGALKDYGHPDQIGRGERHDEYLIEMRRIFRSLHTHTKRNGSMWLVVDSLRKKGAESPVWAVQPLPFELASEAADEGWVLREVIVWLKDKTLPWSNRGRLRNTFGRLPGPEARRWPPGERAPGPALLHRLRRPTPSGSGSPCW